MFTQMTRSVASRSIFFFLSHFLWKEEIKFNVSESFIRFDILQSKMLNWRKASNEEANRECESSFHSKEIVVNYEESEREEDREWE